MRKWWWFVIVPVALVVLVTGGTYVYIHFVNGKQPAPLAVKSGTSTTTASGASGAPGASLDGKWTVGSGSQAGYRVHEILFGQSADAVGRTGQVSGDVTLSGTTATAASVTVDLVSVQSTEARRDNQFRGRIMQVAQFPTATFQLTQPIQLGSIPANGVPVKVQATGNLTVRGVTKPVQASLTTKVNGDKIEVAGSIPITFSEWGIPNPSLGPAEVGDQGTIEFLLVLAHQG